MDALHVDSVCGVFTRFSVSWNGAEWEHNGITLLHTNAGSINLVTSASNATGT